jgi:NAD+ kinase
VAIVSKRGVPEGLRIAAELGGWLPARGVAVRYDRSTSTALGRKDGFADGTLPKDTDLAIVAGGDGTLLSVARAAAPLGVPILGVNFGGLGFLSELHPDELFDGLEEILAGRYTLENRRTLRVRMRRGRRALGTHVALNDAVLAKSRQPRMITVELRLDGSAVATITGDGMIVSTATGSTAYNLSAGGPLLDPRMDALVLSPICPHTLAYRPIVVPGHVRVEMRVRNVRDEEALLTMDGQVAVPLRDLDLVAVELHDRPAHLVRVAGRGFFEVLNEKLGWGSR